MKNIKECSGKCKTMTRRKKEKKIRRRRRKKRGDKKRKSNENPDILDKEDVRHPWPPFRGHEESAQRLQVGKSKMQTHHCIHYRPRKINALQIEVKVKSTRI